MSVLPKSMTASPFIVFECNECGDEFDSGTKYFPDAVAALKAEGWSFKQIDGDWCHYCEVCKS